jgi:lysophospholipase L1-like esterase
VGRIRRLLAHAVLFLAVAAASIAVSLWATPMQQVSAAGQTVQVGVAPPSLDLSGPGQLVLFGQQLPTTLQFQGPVRPRLVLSRITLSEQLAQLTAQNPEASARSLENALVSGWRRYFVWQIVVVGLCAVVLLGAVAGWLRQGAKSTVKLIVIGLVIAEAIDMGAIMITASSTPDKLRSIHSLHDLVGDSSTPASLPGDPLPTREIRKVAVIGDSTAAGQGNRPVPRATADDKACHRSADAFGEILARTDTWDVTNLACGGATVQDGLLGPQWVGDRMQSPQLDRAAVGQADVVIVSIGANDVRWADLLRLCAVANSCANRAAQAYFQQQLAQFSQNLLDLLSRLQLLHNHPIVLVNQYYDPFDPQADCLTQLGMTEGKRRTLEADLSALNTILANAAKTAGFLSVRPDFAGHGICTPQSYVQGVSAKAPFHPNASGQLAIALADEHALHGEPPTSS